MNLSAAGLSDSAIHVLWDEPLDDCWLKFLPFDGEDDEIDIYSPSPRVTSAILTGLTPDTLYKISIISQIDGSEIAAVLDVAYASTLKEGQRQASRDGTPLILECRGRQSSFPDDDTITARALNAEFNNIWACIMERITGEPLDLLVGAEPVPGDVGSIDFEVPVEIDIPTEVEDIGREEGEDDPGSGYGEDDYEEPEGPPVQLPDIAVINLTANQIGYIYDSDIPNYKIMLSWQYNHVGVKYFEVEWDEGPGANTDTTQSKKMEWERNPFTKLQTVTMSARVRAIALPGFIDSGWTRSLHVEAGLFSDNMEDEEATGAPTGGALPPIPSASLTATHTGWRDDLATVRIDFSWLYPYDGVKHYEIEWDDGRTTGTEKTYEPLFSWSKVEFWDSLTMTARVRAIGVPGFTDSPWTREYTASGYRFEDSVDSDEPEDPTPGVVAQDLPPIEAASLKAKAVGIDGYGFTKWEITASWTYSGVGVAYFEVERIEAAITVTEKVYGDEFVWITGVAGHSAGARIRAIGRAGYNNSPWTRVLEVRPNKLGRELEDNL